MQEHMVWTRLQHRKPEIYFDQGSSKTWRYFTSWCAISPCPNRCSREHLKTTSKPVSSGKKIHASHVTIMIRNVLSGSSSALCLRMAQCPQILTTRLLQTFRFWQVPGRMPIQFLRIACLTHEIEVLGLLSRNTIAQFLVPAFSPSHIFGRIGPHFRKHGKNWMHLFHSWRRFQGFSQCIRSKKPSIVRKMLILAFSCENSQICLGFWVHFRNWCTCTWFCTLVSRLFHNESSDPKRSSEPIALTNCFDQY